MLPAFTRLEYLMIKFTEKYSPLDALMEPLDGRDIRYIRDFMRERYIDLVVRASPTTLRWVALEVYGLGLECWEASRAYEGQAARLGGGPICTKTSELAGRAVLAREGMDVFKDVRPSLETVH